MSRDNFSNSPLALTREALLWAPAIVLGLIPLAMGLDFGGYLHWSQWMAALTVTVVGAVALSGKLLGYTKTIHSAVPQTTWRAQTIFLILIAWFLFAWLQTVQLPAGMVNWLSPGAYNSYTQWAAPLGATVDSQTISVAVSDSRHAVAMLLIVALAAWVSPIVFDSRLRVASLLSLLAIAGATIAVIGIMRSVFPAFNLWSFREGGEGSPFGTFLNRNNAALLLNIGFASSLGIVAWRMSAVHDQEVDGRGFNPTEFLSLMGDRASLIGIVCGIICLVGILVCMSRAGIAAMILGSLFAFGLVRQKRGAYSILFVLFAIAMSIVVLALPSGMRADAIERVQASFQENNTASVLADARLKHWPDGWRAGLSYLPAGSGLSTYSYAYLPFQESSTWRWYHHADNLWLELFVEQGILGLLFAAGIFGVVIIALLRMAYSHDPMDEGLRIAGWYLLGAILISQAFDFGLIAPANLFAVVLLLPVIVLRGSMVPRFAKDIGNNTKEDPKPIVRIKTVAAKTLLGKGSLAIMLAACILLLVSAAFVVPKLNRDANDQYLVQLAQNELRGIRRDKSQIQAWIQRLETAAQQENNPSVLNMLAKYQFQLGRLHEVDESAPKDDEQAEQFYRLSSPTVRRLGYRAGLDTDAELTPISMQTKSSRLYQSSLDSTQRYLSLRPLALEPRVEQVHLEFIHRDVARSREAISQASKLYRNTPLILFHLAGYLAHNGELDEAARMWNRALVLRPEITIRVINAALQFEDVQMNDVVPDSTLCYRLAGKHLLGSKKPDVQLFSRIIQRMPCNLQADMDERANCHALVGRLALKIEDAAAAIKNFRSACKNDPLNPDRYLELIKALRRVGDDTVANSELARASEIFEDDKRFAELKQ